jgi:hypothetical protein
LRRDPRGVFNGEVWSITLGAERPPSRSGPRVIPSTSARRPAMALMPCVYCHRVPRARLYTLIWAWHSENGRLAVRTRTCLADIADATQAFGEPLDEEGDYVQLPASCPNCNDPLGASDLALTYLTYWDADGEHRPTFGQCHACAERFRAVLLELGERMEDRPLQNRRRGA